MMNRLLPYSLAVIGCSIGFFVGMTIILLTNNHSLSVLFGFSGVFALVGALKLPKVEPLIHHLDASTKQMLIVLFSILAVICLLFLILMSTLLITQYGN